MIHSIVFGFVETESPKRLKYRMYLHDGITHEREPHLTFIWFESQENTLYLLINRSFNDICEKIIVYYEAKETQKPENIEVVRH
jgi:hypothetical protein